jgi:hypothetical protein
MEVAREAYTTGPTKGNDTAQKLFVEVYTWVRAKYAEQQEKFNVKMSRKDTLERFETGEWSSSCEAQRFIRSNRTCTREDIASLQ